MLYIMLEHGASSCEAAHDQCLSEAGGGAQVRRGIAVGNEHGRFYDVLTTYCAVVEFAVNVQSRFTENEEYIPAL